MNGLFVESLMMTFVDKTHAVVYFPTPMPFFYYHPVMQLCRCVLVVFLVFIPAVSERLSLPVLCPSVTARS